MHTKNLIRTYNRIAPNYFKRQGTDYKFWLPEFKIFKQNINGKKVVDIGCGVGRDARMFRKYGFDYLGIDASPKMIDVARKQVKAAKFRVMNFYRLNFPADSFDGFWAAASLLHVPKNRVAKVLQQIKRILKNKGVGFISLKQKTVIDEGVIKEQKYGARIARFFAFYRKKEFERVCKTAGFKVLKSYLKKSDGDRVWLCFLIQKV